MTQKKSAKPSPSQSLGPRKMSGEEAIEEALALLAEPNVLLTRGGVEDIKPRIVQLLESARDEVNLTKRIDPLREIERISPIVQGTHPQVPRVHRMLRGGVSAVLTGVTNEV